MMTNEKRLIDANALLKIYENWIPQLMLPEDAGDKRGVETCIAVLQDAPTVDAVEVVRCKDCVSHGNCDSERVFTFYCGISNPFCCVGRRKRNG